MFRYSFTKKPPVEHFMLVEPRVIGRIVGYYGGHPIANRVIDYFGRRYRYAGVAARQRNGKYDVSSLRTGEWLVEPGLVYEREDAAR